MKIAVVSRHDHLDVSNWSGTPYYMAKEINKISNDVIFIRPSSQTLPLKFVKAMGFLARKLGRYNIDLSKTNLYSKYIARELEKRLNQIRPEVVVGMAASPELANVHVEYPIIHISDATYVAMTDYYPENTRVPKWLWNEANEIEKKIITQSTMSVFPSIWASDSAQNDYHANSNKVRVVKFGGNIGELPIVDEDYLVRKFEGTCKILFIGKEWGRKGGDILLSAFEKLKQREFEAELTIVGCDPFSGAPPAGVAVYKYINKSDPEQLALYNRLFCEASFFIVPTRAEAYGLVFAEAAAYATPVIAPITGGIPTIVEDGKTGILLPLKAPGSDYADRIIGIWEDKESLKEMSRHAQEKYVNELNWDSWRENFSKLVKEIAD
ncbi:MAG: glycosyltransferase family 4 protein [Proteobacteria bacterium]|nr:glycosyltransferase family 4 protein [Pseudomonadota bacterium]